MINKIKSFFIEPIVLLLLSAFFLRIILANFGTLSLDQNTFIAWAHQIGNLGPKNFYTGWSDYLPGFIYVLWILAKLESILPISQIVLYKLPAILGDLSAGLLVYYIVKDIKNKKSALLASCLILFNPAVLANSTFWGQVDILTTLFASLSIYVFRKNWILSAFCLALGAIIKPQAALAAPVILYLFYIERWRIKKIFLYGVLAASLFLIGFLPFLTNGNIVTFAIDRLTQTLSQYPFTSINAFNFWGIWGFWKPESIGVVSSKNVGLLLFFITSVMSYLKFKKTKSGLFILLSTLFLSNFLFFTRMHERHLLPVLLPLSIAGAIYPSLLIPFVILSINYCLNMHYSYVWIVDNFKEVYDSQLTFFLSLINTLMLFYILFFKRIEVYLQKIKHITQQKKNYQDLIKYIWSFWKQDKEPTVPRLVKVKSGKLFLVLILVFAFLARIFALNLPDHEYFDEVYHAFTAKAMLQGNAMAWEWWNDNPPGFAYEWTHPPLAKEVMVVGMLFFGENSFGYRIPAAFFGTGSVFLIYLIAKKLFNEEVGLLSSFVFSLDGLSLVMSRIGMNDIYLVFFLLLCFLFLLKEKYFISSIALGLALASKWTTFWFVPVLVFSLILLKRKIKWQIFLYILIPPIVYVASYIPLFTTGHDWDIFWGVQKQMWWYHTRLVATHPYTSQWWSWPFLLRPIWLYTSGLKDGYISNIYAFGNPLIFLGGFFSVISSIYYGFVEKRKHLILIVAGYLGVFVPWAISPRIMFLYHYFPAIPFLSIATGFVLFKNKKAIIPFLGVSLLLFIYFYPHLTGLPVSETLNDSYFWFPSWR